MEPRRLQKIEHGYTSGSRRFGDSIPNSASTPRGSAAPPTEAVLPRRFRSSHGTPVP